MENKSLKIIIADDHPLMNHGLATVLSKNENFSVIAQAFDGSMALGLIREYQPDIAILDVQMPKIDGFEVAKIIMKENIPAKIIFLTMFSEKSFVKKTFDLGIKGYVLKENAVTDIVKCVEAVSEGKLFLSPQISSILLTKEEEPRKDENELLTSSEKKILNLIAQEKSSKEIADELFVSVKTIENHRSNICKKLGITGNSALLKYAMRKSQAS